MRLNFTFFLLLSVILIFAFLHTLLDKSMLFGAKKTLDSDPGWTRHLLTEPINDNLLNLSAFANGNNNVLLLLLFMGEAG